MCLIVFAWRPDQPQPLLLAANRDEFYARPSWPLREWDDAPGLFAGRDDQSKKLPGCFRRVAPGFFQHGLTLGGSEIAIALRQLQPCHPGG